MTLATRPTPFDSLRAELERALVDHGRHVVDDSVTRRRLTDLLQRAADLLHDVAMDPRADERAADRLLLLRDGIASHLRASDEIEAADVDASTGLRLLVRAAEGLSAQLSAAA